MLNKKLSAISAADIALLVESRVCESPTLDFKSEAVGSDSSAKHEFLADVCAFANTSGGDLIYGVVQDADAAAKAVKPIEVNSDKESLRLHSVIATGLEPRLAGVEIQAVPVPPGYVLVVRVPKSWSAPHRVSGNRHFYLREGKGKRPLDMPEIRSAFLRSEGLAERIRNIRIERISKILTGDIPVPLFEGVIGVLHIVPLLPLEGSIPVDPIQYQWARRLPVLSLGMIGGGGVRVNLDGAVGHREVTRQGCGAYTRFFLRWYVGSGKGV